MQLDYIHSCDLSLFSDAQQIFEDIIRKLLSNEMQNAEHSEIEQYIQVAGNELLRLLLQGTLDTKSIEEQSMQVISKNHVELNHVRQDTQRTLSSLFGDVVVRRKGYNQRQQKSLFPMDKALNLSQDQFSDGLRKRVVNESIKCAFDNTVSTLDETTARKVSKRQCLNIVKDAAKDFEAFYTQPQQPEDSNSLLIITLDGKGINMRPDSLTEVTRKKRAAKTQPHKLTSRMSPGEKKNKKRMAQVAAVYSILPYLQTPETVMTPSQSDNVVKLPRPKNCNKRVWASLERPAIQVIEEAFAEAKQRDPEQKRQWVVLIDGLPSQQKAIKKVMKSQGVKATIIMDFIHVTEYVWKAARQFFKKDDTLVENWVGSQLLKILQGQCSQVAKGMKIRATKRQLKQRDKIDKCAEYILKNKAYLKYDVALKQGFPIATGVIEGTCRHLINDRFDITGARWSLAGAEALLKLRALKSSGDLDAYWLFHKQQSQKRLYDYAC